MQNKKRIAAAMSGGVDSSVAAKLLKDQGHKVVGIFLYFWKEKIKGKVNFENKCCSTEALMDARRVCNKIGIPLYTLNFSKIFKKQIVDNFLGEYKIGNTPNPCVRCNKLVKLGFLIKQAKKLGFDYIATGHYVKKLKVESKKLKVKYKLYRAKDKNKDQSYFLWTFNQGELKHLLFPLGNYTKPQVRKLAKKFNLPVAEKKESQEVCFIPEKSHNEFLQRHLKLKPGLILSLPSRGRGKVLGKHSGLPLYTIGQRKGIGIGGTGPYYAAKMDYKTNTLYVVDNGNDKILFSNTLIAKNVNWLSDVEPKMPLKCEAVIRYGHKSAKCAITKLLKNKYQVKFEQAQRAITPGQSAVFYSGQEVLGGGIICQN
ncbi:tRNA 2-thiouridine(34) synthase MnmA [Patescibacteria group bacterium]|nr:tRNA 2-thiouridine(34) synthase MnmA [Patescibacteria group bacterium]MBU1663065.1 tRNA 2-thiouridine(34) synthase MnmA [Patescibacteria group bacterium]MBU1934009.1 tRNA 2-thiouridine(34) synthase MnmA [Patescibacteria group bacterium]MBU2007872.1 tRNA 2-thiouridine(34) synthase MnmA [Patescibacteria group bacterium]MBU2233480.1 tRNA 2-thiouridine(34) synthase MnmA [Patescibacteria group bacterium]